MLEVLSLYLFSCVRVPKGGFFKWTYVHPSFVLHCVQYLNVHSNWSNIQHGVRIEAVATSLQEGESTD